MSRILKFRAFDLGEMHNDICLSRYEENVMQYTGLTDGDGTQIYEGDIIRATVTIGGHIITQNATVIFKSGQFTTNHSEVNSWVSKRTKVIGNIFQNPDLLKTKP